MNSVKDTKRLVSKQQKSMQKQTYKLSWLQQKLAMLLALSWTKVTQISTKKELVLCGSIGFSIPGK